MEGGRGAPAQLSKVAEMVASLQLPAPESTKEGWGLIDRGKRLITALALLSSSTSLSVSLSLCVSVSVSLSLLEKLSILFAFANKYLQLRLGTFFYIRLLMYVILFCLDRCTCED